MADMNPIPVPMAMAETFASWRLRVRHTLTGKMGSRKAAKTQRDSEMAHALTIDQAG